MKSFKELRTDPHRPSVMDPADYVFVGAADDHPGDSYLEIRHDILARHGVETGTSDRYSSTNVPFYDAQEDGRPNYRCHHCGKHGSNIRYFCFFLHKPSGQVIVVGQICAKKLSLGSREELDFQKRADEFRRMRQRHQWVDNHQEEFNFLKEYSEADYYAEFLDSLWKGLQQYGSLTDKQTDALGRWMSRGKPWEREPAQGTLERAMEAGMGRVDGDRHQGQVTRTEDLPTQPQIEFINNLGDQLRRIITIPETRQEASNLINALKAELQRSDQPQAITSSTYPATEPQISFINALMDERKMTLEQRREARRQLDEGLTKSQAKRWIDKLKELPKLEDQ